MYLSQVATVTLDCSFWVDTEVPKCQATVQANSVSIYVYIDILFAFFVSFAFRYLGSEPSFSDVWHFAKLSDRQMRTKI